jgi:hypothetical protein
VAATDGHPASLGGVSASGSRLLPFPSVAGSRRGGPATRYRAKIRSIMEQASGSCLDHDVNFMIDPF